MHMHSLRLAAVIAFAVGEGHVIVSSPWLKGPVLSGTPAITPTSQLSVAVGAAGRVAEHWPSHRQGERTGHRRGGVMHMHGLRLAAVIAFAVGEGPGNRIVTLAEGSGLSGTPVITPTSQLSVAVGAAGRVAEHWPVTSVKESALATGAVVSCTCTACV